MNKSKEQLFSAIGMSMFLVAMFIFALLVVGSLVMCGFCPNCPIPSWIWYITAGTLTIAIVELIFLFASLRYI